MLVAKRITMLGILLICSLVITSTSYAGVHFVELPESITNEMMLNQTPELKGDLFDLINEEVQGSVDEIKTIIFTRDGEPWFKNVDPALIANLNAVTKPAMKDDILEDNNLTFNLTVETGTLDWTTEQRADVDYFLNTVASDDGLAHGIYKTSKKLYGPPFFDYTVDVFWKSDIDGDAYWIPPAIYYNGYYLEGPFGGDLYLKYWRNDSPVPKIPDNDRSVLAKAMLMLFWGPFFTYYDQYMDGLSHSGGTTMMSHFSNAYPNYVEIYHGERPDLNEYRPGFIFYDNYNNQAIATGGYNFGSADSSEQLAAIRYQMANMAWFKVYTTGLEQDFEFYKEFNKVLYNYGKSFQGFDQFGYLYYQHIPNLDKLADMAEDAWNHGLVDRAGPEGYAKFDDWRKEQYILSGQKLVPQFGVFSDHNKLKCQIYFPMISNEGDYIEEHPHGDIPVKVQIQKPSGVVIYSETKYATGGNHGYFEVDIPQLPVLTALVCSCEILGDASQYFDEPKKTITTINTGAGAQANMQVMGVLPITWPALRTDSWSIKDPNGTMTRLNITNYAFLFNTPLPNGLEGEYKIYKNGELQNTFEKDKKSFLTNLAWTPDDVFADNNGNGVADVYEQELAEKFQPKMMFHDDNYFRPFPVEIHLFYCNLYWYDMSTSTWNLFERREDEELENWAKYYERAYDWNGPGWIDGDVGLWKSSWPCEHNPTAWEQFYRDNNNFGRAPTTIYYNFFLDNGSPVIQYWFYYPYNDFTVDNHEGDWETVLLKFSSEYPGLATALELDYKYHGKHCYISGPNGEYWLDVFPGYGGDDWPEYQHPIVYVGGEACSKKSDEIEKDNFMVTSEELSGASFPRWRPYDQDIEGWPAWGVVYDRVCHPIEHFTFDDVDLVQILFERGNDDPQTSNYLWLSFPGEWGYGGDIFESPEGPVFSEESQSFLDDVMAAPNDEPKTKEKLAFKEEDKESKSLEKSSKELLPSSDSNITIDLYKHSRELANSELKPDVGYPFDSNIERHTLESGTNPKAIGLDVGLSKTNSPYKPTNLTSDTVTITDNPATTQTTIKISDSLTDGNPAIISIYDISGRLIKSVETDSDYTWDLMSDSGGRVSSGIYIIYIQTATQEIMEKLAVVR